VIIKKIKYFLVIFMSSASILAQNTSFFTTSIENDSLGIFVDRYYSSGIKIEYFSNEIFSLSKYWTQLLLKVTTKKNCFQEEKICHTEMSSYSLNHLIYTPELYKLTDTYRKDRPFAGVFYIANSYSVYLENLIFYNEFFLGNIGPSSQGKHIQEFIHSNYFNTPRSWSHELKDKTIYNWNTGINFLVNKYFMIPLGLGIGNYNTNLNLGLQWRIGDISSKKTFMGHSIQTSSASGFYEGLEENEYYFFIQPLVKFQTNNSTLQGSSPYWDYDWRATLGDKGYKEWERFLLYSQIFFNQTSLKDYLEAVLVFNTAFNNLRYFNRVEARAILELVSNYEISIQDPLFFLSIYNLLQFNHPKAYAIAKYIAFSRILQRQEISEYEKQAILTFLYKNGEFDLYRPHSLKPKNFQGQVQLGFVYRTNEAFLSVSWSLSTLDFPNDPALPQFHAWGRVQAGIFF